MVDDDELGQVVDPFAAEQKKEETAAREKAAQDNPDGPEAAAAAQKLADEQDAAAAKKSAKDKNAVPELSPENLDLNSTDQSASTSLNKGDESKLEVEGMPINNLMIGLGWDAPPTTGEDDEFDLDASAFLLGNEEKVLEDKGFIFYNNLTAYEGAIRHHGDNSTGEGDGDDEIITCALAQIPFTVEQIVFAVTIHEAFERQQHFGLAKNAYIRIVDMDTNKELLRYNLTEDAKDCDAILFGNVKRDVSSWTFTAMGETTFGGLYKVAKEFGVYVAPT